MTIAISYRSYILFSSVFALCTFAGKKGEMRNLLLLFIFSGLFNNVFSQKELHAVKVEQPPKIDGQLDDIQWQQATIATDFIDNNPEFGKPAFRKTEVRVVYDNAAIYVAAMLYDNPQEIRQQLTERDNEGFQNTDFFSVAFDTYNDKQNAFRFLVTPANVQSDIRISSALRGTDNDGYDYNWDAVWESKTSITTDGWIVEMKIPYSAIRFSSSPDQTWGVNFSRYIRRRNETSYWNPVDPALDGVVNQSGLLTHLIDLEPPLRLSFSPYVSFGYSDIPYSEGRLHNFLYSGGMDVKYGINESFTIDMTLVPDFGQVESDNIILNLSPFEQQFNEKRPFFTEGTELFNRAGIFYSRRIGEVPGGYFATLQLAKDSAYTILKNPSLTHLYNATKFSGRTKNGLGIGFFNAITAPVYSTLEKPDGTTFDMETEPLTNYNIFVLDQSLKNRSAITFTNTNVLRKGNARNANVSALGLNWFDKSNNYNLQSQFNYSNVWGLEKYDGFKTFLGFNKVGGKWLWSVANEIRSQNYDPNDLGILFTNNQLINSASVLYRTLKPDKLFTFRRYNFRVEQTNRFYPFAYSNLRFNLDLLHVFLNYWDISFTSEYVPIAPRDFYELRLPGRVVKLSPYGYFGVNGSTDSRKKLFASYEFGYANLSPVPDDPYFNTALGLRYRFNSKFSMEINGSREFDKGNIGFAFFESPETPVIGRREITEFATTVKTIYNFRARMNLNFRLRHYWSRVHYTEMFGVADNGDWLPHDFVEGHDDNFNAFNIDLFFTWDFRPGSKLVLSWKNGLGPDTYLDGSLHSRYYDNFIRSFKTPHSNELSVKFIYHIDAGNLFRQGQK